ncbi:MAG: DUF4129 domain-containing protein [Halorientalis sp.]
MERRTLRSAVVAVCGVLAVGISAATLTTTVETGTGGGEGTGAGGGGGVPPPPPASGPEIPLPHVPYLEELLLVALAIAFVGLLVYLLLYWRVVLYLVVGLALVLGIAVLIVTYLFSSMPSAPGLFSGAGGGIVGADDAGGGMVPSVPTLALLTLVVVAAVGVLAAVFGAGREGQATASDGGTESEADPAAVGRAAGAAADRLDAAEATVGNEVYRAWREMTALLDVDRPETTTPGEFERAAVDAGMADDDVRELRRLFEDVRYGERDPTDVDERRAMDVFRRIEAAYTPEDDA